MSPYKEPSKKRRGCFFYLTVFISLVFLAIAAAVLAVRFTLTKSRPWLEKQATEALGAPVTISRVHLSLWPEAGISLEGVELDGASSCLPHVRIADALLLFDIEAISEKKILLDQLLIRGVQVVVDAAENDEVRARCVAAHTQSAPSPAISNSRHYALRSVRIENATYAPRRDQSVSPVSIERATARVELVGDRISVDRFAGKLELNQHDFDVSVDRVQYGLNDHDISVQGVRLNCDTIGSLELAELIKVSDGEYKGDLKTRLDVKRMASFLHSLGAAVNSEGISGELTGVLSFAGSIHRQQISGTIEGKNILGGSDRRIAESIKVDHLQIALNAGALERVSATVSGKALDFKFAAQRYRADSLQGPVTVSKEKGIWRFGGDITLARFVYSDDQTTVERISGSIKKIVGTVKPSGEISITLMATSDKIALKSPGFFIEQAERLSAPITISIPAKGGYEVRGPVTFSNAVMGSSRWRVNSAKGVVDILISHALKRFATSQIQSRVKDAPLVLTGAFEMTADAYLLRNMHLTGGKIDVSVDGAYARVDGGKVSAQVRATDSDLKKVVALYDEQTAEPLDGTIKSFNTTFVAKRGALLATATGDGRYTVSNGRLSKRANLIRSMARAVQQVPVISYLADIIVGETRNTSKRFQGEFTLQNGTMNYQLFSMKTDNFSLEGTGTATLEGALNLKAEVIFARDTVSKLSLGISMFKKLLRSATAISIPITIGGRVSDPQVAVDVVPFMKRYSGLSTVESIADGAIGVGSAIGDVLVSPFRSSTPTPSAVSTGAPSAVAPTR